MLSFFGAHGRLIATAQNYKIHHFYTFYEFDGLKINFSTQVFFLKLFYSVRPFQWCITHLSTPIFFSYDRKPLSQNSRPRGRRFPDSKKVEIFCGSFFHHRSTMISCGRMKSKKLLLWNTLTLPQKCRLGYRTTNFWRRYLQIIQELDGQYFCTFAYLKII